MRHRYPGVQPFKTSEQDLFFGRDKDIADLCDLISLEKLVVLFAKSGYGKSSLLNAGVIPKVTDPAGEAEQRFLPLTIRLFAADEKGTNVPPVERVRQALVQAVEPAPGSEFLERLVPESERTLWFHFKRRQSLAAPPNHQSSIANHRFLLIFDQFEEFFTYPEAQQQAFKDQLAEVLYKAVPQTLRDAAAHLDPAGQAFLAARCDVRAVFAIRADRLGDLDRMKDKLPAILHKRFELRALDEAAARRAIILPSELPGTDFASPAFHWLPEAVDETIARMSSKGAGRIEAFLLQILCQHVEGLAIKGKLKDVTGDAMPDVTLDDLPDPERVFEEYYHDKIAALPALQQDAARRVVEFGLLFVNPETEDARRLSKDSEELLSAFGKFGLTAELLTALENTFLLRREANTLGGYSYEISHDTLVKPVQRSRKRREEIEREQQRQEEAERKARELEDLRHREEEAQRRAEEEQKLREKAQENERRARQRTRLAAVAFVLALALAWFAWRNSVEAKRSEELAKQKTEEAERELKARIDLEVKKYVAAAKRMIELNDRIMARKILDEAMKLDSTNQDVHILLKKLQQ